MFQQTRLSNIKYAMDGTRHVKTLQQILVLRQSRQAKWSCSALERMTLGTVIRRCQFLAKAGERLSTQSS